MAAWVLPDHIADVLPSEARHIEELRRLCLDTARSFGYELVMPPLVEHVQSLLITDNPDQDLQTLKMVDRLSGRTLGLRIDTTPQTARIDAHLLNRAGVTRLCYAGSVVHSLPASPYATREPLQLGAEIYGHQGLEADLEILQLAVQCLEHSGLKRFRVDLSHARIRAFLNTQLQPLLGLGGDEQSGSDFARIAGGEARREQAARRPTQIVFTSHLMNCIVS